MSTTDTPPQVKKINLREVAELKRTKTGTQLDTTYPMYYYKTGRQLGFLGQDGAAVTADCSMTVWYYRTPVTDGSEDISDSYEPIIDQRWDNCMVYGACFELTGDEKWLLLYERELSKIRTLETAQANRTYYVPLNTDYD